MPAQQELGRPPHWWQAGIIYQIYPRSFQDSNHDGVGDLPGIISRLDYCRWLGVNAVWISPIYPSPMIDFGYDVSNYTDIHPLFGTLADFDALVAEAHRLGLKLVLDFVPNHTSDQHPWFRESRSSRDNPRREWYLWHDPAPGGGPPNNWLSVFGGSAWQWDEATGQYYLHSYLKEQPDLNWRNPELRQAMWNVLRFWLERGVDGFRVDAIARLIKDKQFRDNPPNPNYMPGDDPAHQLLSTYSMDQPELRDVLREMRQVIDEYPERALIGESHLPLDRLVTFYKAGVSLPFNFHLIRTDWRPAAIRAVVDSYEGLLDAEDWPDWVLGSHDDHRLVSRIGSDQARLAAMLLLTLRGTPTMYYGDEIGMHDVEIPPNLVQDPFEKNVPGKGLGRDPERTPMQWNAEPNAGFTTGTPWLPVADDYQQVNVEAARRDPRSLLTLYRRLIELRHAEPALHLGAYAPLLTTDAVLAWWRTRGTGRFLIVLNFSRQPERVKLPDADQVPRIVLSTALDRDGEELHGSLALRPVEGVIVRFS